MSRVYQLIAVATKTTTAPRIARTCVVRDDMEGSFVLFLEVLVAPRPRRRSGEQSVGAGLGDVGGRFTSAGRFTTSARCGSRCRGVRLGCPSRGVVAGGIGIRCVDVLRQVPELEGEHDA